MKHLFAFSIVIILLISACQSDSGQMTPNSGFEYEYYTDAAGPKAVPGQYVYFQFDIYDDKDSLLQTYRNQPQTPAAKIPPAGDPVLRTNPVIDALSMLSVGDSIGITMPSDSIKNLPPGYEDIKYFLYKVVVQEIVEDSVYMNRMEEMKREQMAKAEAIMAQFDDVKSLANKTIEDYKRNRLELLTTPQGVKYYIHEQGEGTVPTPGSSATILYYGALVSDATMFDNSFERGRGYPVRVGAGSVIRGWDETIPYLPQGTKASLFIPSDMGYGEAGSPPRIPGGAELYFYVEVDEVTL